MTHLNLENDFKIRIYCECNHSVDFYDRYCSHCAKPISQDDIIDEFNAGYNAWWKAVKEYKSKKISN